MDILKYKPVIQTVLTQLRVPKPQQEDMTQECYLALLEHMKEEATDGYAASICKGTIMDIRKKESQNRQSYKSEHGLRFDSLSDPRIAHKAAKVIAPVPDEVGDENLYAAISSLPGEEQAVIQRLYVAGMTQEQAAADLGLSRDQVWRLKNKGVKLLKKYFEVN